MDDSCAVCAETLEWVSYGPCGHKEVCSTCVARLRFICDDRCCCICKTESNFVFVTKALGDYTRMINDFSVLPSEVKEGRVGPYWYHEDTQAYFDDLDHYKMIKAMCRLSCSVCDKMEQQPGDGPKRRGRFRNIEQLRGHLFHQHRLLMCSLCLEGRKVFICEQKLYTKAQLNQHINTGDSEVDGTENERGGFMGHPMCEFCRNPFYGDNELYLHMSTEHYTCHICLRQHPGQYEYYKNYDDLEIHFRQEHFLCEDEACLGKKFIVFQSEAEMKRHNTLEHGGRMSRAKRSAALQIPTSFRYRSSVQDNRRGSGSGRGGRTFRRDDAELSMAIQASLESANTGIRFNDPPLTNPQVIYDNEETSDIDPIIQPFESLATSDAEPSSRYLQAVSHASRKIPLEDSSFPPLSTGPTGGQQMPKPDPEDLPKNTMAAHLRRQNKKKVNVVNNPTLTQGWPAPSRGPAGAPSISPLQARPQASSTIGSSTTTAQNKASTDTGYSPFNYSSVAQARPSPVHEPAPAVSSSSSRNWVSANRAMSHSNSAPNLVETGSFDPSISDFPPVSAVVNKAPASSQAILNVKDVQSANKSLVERIRTALEFDEDKYSAFKEISGGYRQGLIDTGSYLAYVESFGLSHLVVELAKLCPDPRKQKELIETYNANLLNNGFRKKGKEKSVYAENNSSKDNLADGIINSVRKLQSSYQPSEEVETLSKDGYRSSKGKSKVTVVEPRAELSSRNQPIGGGGTKQNSSDGDGNGKGKHQRKKTSKFHRVRLGEGSLTSHSDPDPDPDLTEPNPGEGVPVRGVWRNGGGHKLLSK